MSLFQWMLSAIIMEVNRVLNCTRSPVTGFIETIFPTKEAKDLAEVKGSLARIFSIHDKLSVTLLSTTCKEPLSAYQDNPNQSNL